MIPKRINSGINLNPCFLSLRHSCLHYCTYTQGVGIHEGVALALAGRPERRFTVADVAFLVRWLEEKGRQVFVSGAL